MSYILSALRKAARERDLGKLPDISSDPGMTGAGEGRSSRNYGVIGFAAGIGALIAVNVALFMSMNDPGGPEPAVKRVAAPEEAKGAGITPGGAFPSSEEAGKSGPAQRARDPAGIVKAPAEPAVADEDPPDIPLSEEPVDYADLPADVRNALPVMNISGHVYVPRHPGMSRVIINGHSLRVGSAVGGGVHIEDITADEILFSLNGRHFRMLTEDLF